MKYRLPITEDVENVVRSLGDYKIAIRNGIFKLRTECDRYGSEANAVRELLDFAESALLEKDFLNIEPDGTLRCIPAYSMALSHIRTAEKTLVEILGVYVK